MTLNEDLLPKGAKPILPFATSEKKGLTIKPFRFLNLDSARSVPKSLAPYRDIRLVEGKKRKYVSFYFRIPTELQAAYGGKAWKRFRVFEEINRCKDPDWAARLLQGVRQSLESGAYDPFKYEAEEKQLMETERKAPQPKAAISLHGAMEKFIADCTARKLRPRTVGSYQTLVNFLETYFGPAPGGEDLDSCKLYRPAAEVSYEDIKEFLSYQREENEWSGQTYNNKLGYLHVLFNWFAHKDNRFVTENPALGIREMPVDGTAHQYYNDAQAQAVKEALAAGTPQMRYIGEYFQPFIYYTGTRPVEEARYLQCGHVEFERKLLKIPGEVSKNRKTEYVPMCAELIELLEKMGVRSYPPNYYLFSAKLRPDEKPASPNYFAQIFRPVKQKLKLPDHTIYSWKHTRAIHLAEAGATPYEVQKLFRHGSLSETENYMRGLGCRISSEVSEKTRKY